MSQPVSLSPRRDRPHNLPDRTLTIHVNEQAVELTDRRPTGLDIKTAAKAQGVAIELDFVLVEELGGGRTRVIGDQDQIQLNPHSRFLVNDGDDNS
jgi:hypothetical protein